MSQNSPCICCGSTTTVKHQLSPEKLRAEFARYFQSEAPEKAIPQGYALLKCSKCELEFAEPMIPGNSEFYEWICSFPTYYPKDRWEWHEVADRVKSSLNGQPSQGLEVGCGTGTFLRFIHAASGLGVTGIDMTAPSIDSARKQGSDVVLGDFDQFSAARPDAKFQYLFAFHCLEHVTDPVRFMVQCKRFLAPGGSIFISVPMSPMYFESRWFDPLNHPPHHLSRWSPSSIQALGRAVGLVPQISSEPAPPAVNMALRTLHLATHGNSAAATKTRLLSNAMLQPIKLLAEVRNQFDRQRLNGVSVGNILLAEFKE
jgi:SAM-dependent methyltransferase